MATARPKISLKIRVLRDAKTAGDWGKLYDEVQMVIDWSVQKAAAHTECGLQFERYVMLCYVILSHRATRTQRVKVRSHHAQCHPLIGFMRRQNPMPGCRRCGRTRITGRCR